MHKYILVNCEPVIEDDIYAWGAWMQTAGRSIKQTKVGRAIISTVFLGLDHSWGYGTPVLFETMVFGGKMDQCIWRHTTYDAALTGHKRAVQLVKGKRHAAN